MVREVYLTQKLSSISFASSSIDISNVRDLEGETEEGVELDTDMENIVIGQKREIFRDKLQQMGGDLSHNLIKLKYERKIKKVKN